MSKGRGAREPAGSRVPNLNAFERRAEAMFREIPARYREGVDGVRVRPERVPHPELPEIFTLGECRTEEWPSPYGGPGALHSSVVLYHGSFVALAAAEPEFDWEAELWETLTHELRHHLESRANEDALERLDYAEDQGYARAAGEPFDPLFYRSGER
ncbi:MAG: metallopeptidase family protein, partial [Gemmatimonadota bacterium]